ncbi:PREDICTED: uncharacterized protein LOC101293018 [Fragaria vesca subsp. vesca]|uniref:uncharacterized protein LOC101293018 n=1 Tax=Fragaria vesca subsp. vesca TaxID=101020 RepID=UPI0002C32E4C|nr:PREDICTED: uncharacterized protein LOC101293018 [Fragaria vesca subsp. vesca]
MASGLHQWESDPLFSAAEVVQDSADRMESIFRFLLHELGLVQDDFPDPKLHASIDYHKRELATTLETAKWQLEDFERAVSFSAMTGKSQINGDVISRHKQFIRAIREQIAYVEKSLEGKSIEDPMRNTRWVNLNEQDRDGLALFLTGGNVTSDSYDGEDSNMLRRFLDPATSSSAKDGTSGIVEQKSREVENGVVHVDNNINSRKENNLRKVSSYPNTRLGFEFTETSCKRHGEGGSWDLEADEAIPENFSSKNKLRGVWSRINPYGFLTNIWTNYGSRVTRSYTKRFKDGEEQSHSPSSADVSHAPQGNQGMWLANGYRYFNALPLQFRTQIMHLQSWLGVIRARYQRSPYRIQVQRYAILLVLIIVLGLIIIGTHLG